MLTERIGVAIIAYNRPDYFQWLLHSLENQVDPGACAYHLFIDGAKCEADKQLIEQSINLFEIANLPNKVIHRRQKNVSIAINQFEARNFMADHYDHFIMAEDDILLSKYAMRLIRVLGDYISDEIFSASISFIRKAPKGAIDLYLNKAHYHHRQHWWFELYRSANWRKVRPYFKQYYDLVKDGNYKMRNHRQITDFYKSEGFDEHRTSQDSGMDYALFKAGMKRISTFVNRGMYLGVNGTHFNEMLAENYRFPDQVPFLFESDKNLSKFIVKGT